MSGNQQQQVNTSGSEAFAGARFAIEAWAISVEVFLRTGFGARYIGAKGAVVLLMAPMSLLFFQDQDPRPLLWFLVAYLVMVVIARIDSLRRRSRGDTTHSFYSGWPRLMKIFPRCSEVTVKKYVEPLFVGIVGVAIGNHNVPLAMYLLMAAICLFVSVFSSEEVLRRRVAEMNDAVNEQEIIAERFREIRGETF